MVPRNQYSKEDEANRKGFFAKKCFRGRKLFLYMILGSMIGLLIPAIIFFADFYISHWPSKSVSEPTRPRVIQRETLQQPQERDFSSWQTYRNTEFGYSVKIPPQFEQQESTKGNVVFRAYTQEGKWVDLIFSTSIHSTDYSPESLNAWVEGFRSLKPGERVGTTTIKIQNINLNGFIAPQYLINEEAFADLSENYDYTYVTILAIKNTSSNSLALDAEQKRVDVESYKILYDQILSTFRFVDSIEKTATDETLCSDTGGLWIGCPENPLPNTGICIAHCSCPEGFRSTKSGCRNKVPDPIPTDKQSCIDEGGAWRREGLAQAYICVFQYSDGGKECQSSNECEGSCLVYDDNQGTSGKGTCDKNTIPFGCYATIENFEAGHGILCRD